MRIGLHSNPRRGIALILVLISVVVLAVLAAGFAYSMRVEVKLARNASNERELEWMGRSGVELARYVVGLQMALTPFDALDQKWAGGPGGMAASNSPLADIQLENIELGNGKFSVKIVDAERKMSISAMVKPGRERILHQGLILAGVDATDSSTIMNCILDWLDDNDLTRVGGAEKDYYQGEDPPYLPKNGPIDDMTEMLLIKGVTPDLLWGPASTNHVLTAQQARDARFGRAAGPPINFAVGLMELFNPTSSGQINLNTASATVLQLLPYVDANVAEEIIRVRSGQGVTEEPTPFRNPGELINAGLPQQVVQEMLPFCTVRSTIFEVQVDAEVGTYRRQFVALLWRQNPRDVHILSFYSR